MSKQDELTPQEIHSGALAAIMKAVSIAAETIMDNHKKEENGLQKLAKTNPEFDTPAELDSAVRKYYDSARKFKMALPKKRPGISAEAKAKFKIPGLVDMPDKPAGTTGAPPVAKSETPSNPNSCSACEKGEVSPLSFKKSTIDSLGLEKSYEHGLCKSCGASYKRQVNVNKNDENITSNSPWDIQKSLQRDNLEVPMNGVVIAEKRPGAKLPTEDKPEDLSTEDEGEVKTGSVQKGAISDAVAATREKLKDKLGDMSEGEARRAGFPGTPKDAKDTNTKPVEKAEDIPSAPRAPASANTTATKAPPQKTTANKPVSEMTNDEQAAELARLSHEFGRRLYYGGK